MNNTPSKAEIEALVKRHGATSYRNRADTQHPAYGFTEDGLNGLIDEVLAKWAAPQQEPTEIPEEIERMAAARYKVVPSHESMFHRWAVVAGTGTQQLYLGREVECENMARKFAGAFLDGAFVTMQSTSPNPAPAPLSEREAFEAWIEKDGGDLGTFGTPPNMHYRNSAVNNAWVAWKARAAIAAQGGKA